MRARWLIAAIGCAGCAARSPHRGECLDAASTRSRAETAERQGRLFTAIAAFDRIAKRCRERRDDDATVRLQRELDFGDAVAKAHAGAGDAAASADAKRRGNVALERVRELRARLRAGAFAVEAEVDAAFAEAAAAYAAAFAAKPDVDAIVAVASVWREADVRREANRAADRALAFAEAVAGERLHPTLFALARGAPPTDPIDGVPSAYVAIGNPEDPDSIDSIAWVGRGKSLLVSQVDGGLRWWRPGRDVVSVQIGSEWLDHREGWLEQIDTAGPDAPIGAMWGTVLGSDGTYTPPAMSSDGERVVVGHDRRVEVRSRRADAIVEQVELAARPMHVAADRSGATVAAIDEHGALWLWSPPRTPQQLAPGTEFGQVLAISADGDRIFAQLRWSSKLRVVRASDGSEIATVELGDVPVSIAWPIVGVVPKRGGGQLVRLDLDGKIRWRGAVMPDQPLVVAVAGERIATGGESGLVRMWRATDGRELASLAATNPLGPSSIFVRAAPLPPEWAVITPGGDVDGSKRGDALLKWRAGDVVVPGFVGWERYRRPDLLGAVLGD